MLIGGRNCLGAVDRFTEKICCAVQAILLAIDKEEVVDEVEVCRLLSQGTLPIGGCSCHVFLFIGNAAQIGGDGDVGAVLL